MPGYRVLVIGADHQCTATELLLGEDRFVWLDSGRRKVIIEETATAADAAGFEAFVVFGVDEALLAQGV